MKSKVDNFVVTGIATRLMSQYSSPALLVKKPKSKGEKDPLRLNIGWLLIYEK